MCRRSLHRRHSLLHCCIHRLLRLVMIVAGWFSYPYTHWQARHLPPASTRLPPISDPLLRTSATQLARMIRERRCTSEAVIRAYVARCRAVNPLINAIVAERFDAALLDAQRIDAQIASGAAGSPEQMARETPLLGLPLTVKESIAVRGLSHQAGRRLAAPHVATVDAPAVAQARRAGAIVLAVSNTPELCMCWETYNAVTGLTCNPYNLRRTAGGSSGGEAALLASGCSLLGLCSDIAGSSRLPAAFCGVFGHKPTPFAVSPDGHSPKSPVPNWGEFFTIAPMTRYAGDLALLLRSMADPERRVLNAEAIVNESAVDVSAIRCFYMPDDGPAGSSCPVQPDVRRAVKDVARLLGGRRVRIDELKYALDISMSAMLRIPEVETIYADRDPTTSERVRTLGSELWAYVRGNSASTFPSVAVGPLQAIVEALPAGGHRKLAKIARRLKRRFAELLGENGVFVYPTFPNTAHRHYEIYHKLVEPSYMMVFNTIGLPVTNCMVRLDGEGLPIGVQVSRNINIGCNIVRT